MKVRIIGSGTSTGVPQIGCTCPVCTSSDPKDNRLRASAIVETDDARILIDCGPDFRTQVLHLPFERIDGEHLSILNSQLANIEIFCSDTVHRSRIVVVTGNKLS